MAYMGKTEGKSQGFHFRLSREEYNGITASFLAEAHQAEIVRCLETARRHDLPYKTEGQIEELRRRVLRRTGRSTLTSWDLVLDHLRRTGHVDDRLDGLLVTH